MTELLLILIVVVGILILRSYNQRLQRLESRILELQNAIAGHVLAVGTGEISNSRRVC